MESLIPKINSRSRKSEVVECRQMMWSLIKEIYKNQYSFKEIGFHCGKRDQKTVDQGINRINEMVCQNKFLKTKKEVYLNEVTKRLALEKESQSQLNRIELLEKKVEELEEKFKKYLD